MNPHWAWLNVLICYDVPGSHANHGPHIHTCSCRTRERNLPGRHDAVVTTLLILRYKPFPHDYTNLRRDVRREAVCLKKILVSSIRQTRCMAFAHGLEFLKSLVGIDDVNVDWITELLFVTRRWVLDGKR